MTGSNGLARVDEWRTFMDRLGKDGPLRDVILESWTRSAAAGVDAKGILLERVSEEELARRLEASEELLAAAKPHLHWLSASLAEVRHVTYVVDRDGIVLYSTGNAPELVEQAGLLPGYDWSEKRMGTNGAGTALIAAKPVAVIGPEHFVTAFDDCTCTAAPIRDTAGKIIAAIDVTTSVQDGEPSRLAQVAHAAVSVEQAITTREVLRQLQQLRTMEAAGVSHSEVRVPKLLARILLRSPELPSAIRYGVAILSTIAAVFSTIALTDVSQAPFFPVFMAAVLIAVVVSGFRPALLTIALAALATAYLAPPRGSLHINNPEAVTRLAVFIALATVIAWLVGTLRSTLEAVSKSERTVRQERERFAVTLSSIGDAVIATDPIGQVTFMNKVAQSLTGWSLGDALSKPLDEVFNIVSEQSRRPVENPVTKTLRMGTVVGLANHTVLLRKDGTELAIDDSAAPIRDEAGNVIGVVMVFRDVTQQRKDEQERQQMEEVLRRTEKLNATSQLASSLAHEINNPLATVTNCLYLLRNESGLTPAGRGYLETADRDLRRVSHIAQLSLAFYRDSVESETVALTKVLDEITDLFAYDIRERAIEIEKRYDSQGEVQAFRGEIRQILTNIVRNAIDAVAPGGRIRFHVVDSHLHRRAGVRLYLSDNGPGIPKELQAKIFEPFATTKQDKGTGLGLWVARDLVHKYGGTIGVRSSTQPGRSGSCFSVFLPAVSNQSATAVPTSPS